MKFLIIGPKRNKWNPTEVKSTIMEVLDKKWHKLIDRFRMIKLNRFNKNQVAFQGEMTTRTPIDLIIELGSMNRKISNNGKYSGAWRILLKIFIT